MENIKNSGWRVGPAPVKGTQMIRFREQERWITMGQGQDTKLLVVVHTHAEIAEDIVAVRIISVRRLTRHEIRQYEEGSV